MTMVVVTRDCVSHFVKVSGDKPHPPSHYVRHPPPPHRAPRKQSLRGWILGRWAFIRPMRRIIVILFTLGRWALDHPALRAPLRRGELYSATVLGQRQTYSDPDGNLGGGIRPPRHADACHPSVEGNFVPRRYWGSGRHILTQMGT